MIATTMRTQRSARYRKSLVDQSDTAFHCMLCREFTEDGPSTRRAVASGLPSDDIESFHSTGDSSRILSAQDTKSTKDDSHISSSSKTMTKDPLAEFYDLARAERDAEVCSQRCASSQV